LAALSPTAHAVVESGHWSVYSTPLDRNDPYSTNLSLAIDQTPAGDYTGSFFRYDPLAGTLQFVTLNVDEGSTLFVTRPGQLINDQTIANLPAGDRLSYSNNLVQVGSDFYVGGATEKFTDPEFQWNDQHWTVFGWAHLRADASGQLQLVDSAVSFNEGGIVAGTLAVPEAGTWSMMGLGLIGVALATRRRTTS
jgi:hypothetical protein